MPESPRSKTSVSVLETAQNIPAASGRPDRYQILLDAEVGRLTHELKHPRPHSSQIPRAIEARRPTR